MRYEIAQAWYDGGRKYEVLARAVDVDGLFSLPVPPERERVVLRGCTAPVDSLTGDVFLEIKDGRAWELWRLGDLVVHAELPGGDLVCSASAFQLDNNDEPVRPRYVLSSTGGGSTVLGTCRVVEGFPRSFDEMRPPVTLIGCTVSEFTASERPGVRMVLRALDRDGRVVAETGVRLDIVSAHPSAVGPGLFDIVLDGVVLLDEHVPDARPVWRIWMEGTPTERNLWAPLSPDGRMVWKEIAADAPRVRPTAGVHHVDGAHATEKHGLHLALNEALVGSGHYLGIPYWAAGPPDLWGLPPGLTVVWHDPGVALEAVPDLFFGVLKYLRRTGIDVSFEPSTPDLTDRLSRWVDLGAMVDRWIAGSAWTSTAGSDRVMDNWQFWNGPQEREYDRILTGDADVVGHAENIASGFSETWLTVPTDSPDEVIRTVEKAGLAVRSLETFMRRSLTDHPAPEPPDGYAVEVTRKDAVIEVRVLSGRAEAASGLIAVVGSDAVPRRVTTTAEHRRRGLGSVVMGVLAREAVAAGAVDGLLFATADGLHLCRKLGWQKISDVVIASRRGSMISELVERWHRGWIAADGLTSSYRDGYLVVHVNRAHRANEWIATDDAETAAMARIVAATEEPNWLSVPTDVPEKVTAEMEAAGLIVARPDETFMRCELIAHPPLFEPPAGYAVEVSRGPVIGVRVVKDGEVAASGLMAVVGEDAVAHRIETAQAHRRRGLGSVVMSVLVREAMKDGATTGLLFSSTEGVHLYRRLGWERISDLVVAKNQVEV
ncbi:GNAT family N-acetyltransferase [Lentzea sp. NEAU-D13]|uniref:GNAT family N-acetyltransferase n=1 Tax=Lentzea alba TaxID=2714351 RepID=A0A7C9VUH8_9PSEU|nr:GNAT family N-acetyltransferase [Lentzea alba]NGY61116.1 GNAT family N-acetyltransferase [Lentzea alba]